MHVLSASRAVGLLMSRLAADEAEVLAGAVLLEVHFTLAVPAKQPRQALRGEVTGATG